MTYTASEIVERARNLADLKDTDFLSHTEITQYLNDSYTEVINSIIDKGDKQFVREVMLGGTGTGPFTEYEMPKDLYIIHSIKTVQGSLVPRAPVGSAPSSGCYEIINNKIRIYGAPYGAIIMTYWLKPYFISYPDKDVSIPYTSSDIMSSAGDSILLSDGTVYNVLNQSTIAELTLDTDNYAYHLGNGHYVEDGQNVITWKDYLGSVIDSISYVGGTMPNHSFIFDNNYNVLLAIEANDGSRLISRGQKQLCVIPAGYIPLAVYKDTVVCYKEVDTDAFIYAVYDREAKEIVETEETHSYNDDVAPIPVPDFDGMHAILANGALVTVDTESLYVREEPLDIDAFYYFRYLRYGVLCSNGTDAWVMSRFPDTLFNFPNEVLYSLVAANLGLKFLAKQNADSSGLKEVYENMYNVYTDSLSQDASYPIVRNAYF